MSAILNTVKNTFSNTKFLIILAVAGLLIYLAFWVYTTYVAPKINPTYQDNKEFVSSEDDASDESAVNEATMYMFYTDWCPHCKAAMKEDSPWKSLQSEYKNKKYNGVTMHFVEVNGEKEEGELQSFESNHGVQIDGFPTIYLVKGNNVIEFASDITTENLTNFLDSAL